MSIFSHARPAGLAAALVLAVAGPAAAQAVAPSSPHSWSNYTPVTRADTHGLSPADAHYWPKFTKVTAADTHGLSPADAHYWPEFTKVTASGDK